MRSEALLYIFANLFIMAALTEDSWILLAASAFNLVQYAVLVEEHEENQASHNYINEKESTIFSRV